MEYILSYCFAYAKLKELFGFCETLATLVLRATKLLLKNPKTFFNAV
jgi:hypothetical protein